jgi:uncharacterized protein
MRNKRIHPRKAGVNLEAARVLDWLGGDEGRTAMLNAISLSITSSETFFLEVLRETRPRITDEILASQIDAFLVQEGAHRKEHTAYNELLKKAGVDIVAYEGVRQERLALVRSWPLDVQLGIVAAAEFYTDIVAEAALEDEGFLEGADSEYRRVWEWHALEEVEHNSVSFDTLRYVNPSYWLRAKTFLMFTRSYVKTYYRGVIAASVKVRREHPWRLIRAAWSWFGPLGHITRRLPRYFSYLLPNFHPARRRHAGLIARYQEKNAFEIMERYVSR